MSTLTQTVIQCDYCRAISKPASNAGEARRHAQGWAEVKPLGDAAVWSESEDRYWHRTPARRKVICPECLARLAAPERRLQEVKG